MRSHHRASLSLPTAESGGVFPHLEIVVESIDDLAPGIRQFRVRRADSEPYPFQPGQHLLFWHAGKYTAFSISSRPGEFQSIEFAVRQCGVATGYLCETVRVGDRLPVTEAQGEPFDSKKLAGRELWFIAGGIGLMGLSAQILGLETAIGASSRGDPGAGRHRLLYGLKDRAQLLWPDRLARWRAFMEIEITGDGRHLVSDLIPAAATTSPDLGQVTALICGPATFFRPVYDALVALGFDPGYILDNIWE